MDLLELGCSCLTIPQLKGFMDVAPAIREEEFSCGALLGSLCGYWTERKLLPEQLRGQSSNAWFGAWLTAALLSFGALLFFWLLEGEIALHKLSVDSPRPAPGIARIEFGAAAARANLVAGWTDDRVWPEEGFRQLGRGARGVCRAQHSGGAGSAHADSRLSLPAVRIFMPARRGPG